MSGFQVRSVRAGCLEVTYLEVGAAAGVPVVLLHGFPYDVTAYTDVAHLLAADGYRCLVPFLRGFGPTRFLSAQTPRSGEQAALGADLLAFLDALRIKSAGLAGFDWGGRAACVVAALWPERVLGLVSCGSGYNIQSVAASIRPAAPEDEYRLWYQYYFQSERGRAGLERNRRDFCKLLWRLWSPNWRFSDRDFTTTSLAFANPDFVAVVIHSYRVRYGLVATDPQFEILERNLARLPPITSNSLVLHGQADGVDPPRGTTPNPSQFLKLRDYRILARVGHNVPQEAPREFADAVRRVVPR